MSGGVDSSVSAALLKQAGHDVTGVFIKVWQPDWIECNWREERIEALRAAAHIGIPCITLDLEYEYKTEVIDYMIAEYTAGRTPNPDVMCNREVKFGALWRWAQAHGADYVATGHYAQIKMPPHAQGAYELHAGVDTNKDQSYFLWTLNQADLAHIMFPVGHLTKPEVRERATSFKLPNADKKDSQGLCFIGKIDVKEFLSHYIHETPGQVLNEKGVVIGTHSGARLLTLGERRGFTIAHTTPHETPYYIISKDIQANTITVAHHDTDAPAPVTTTVTLRRVNWVGSIPALNTTVHVRTRYRQTLHAACITERTDDTAILVFSKTHEIATPGQSLVMYDGSRCIGGGIIV